MFIIYYTGNCYQVFYESKSWGEAEILCLSYGGHLASINSEDENNFIATLMKETGYFWVGGHDIVTEEAWQWTDHSAWSYSDWAANKPTKNYGSNCLRYSASPAVGRFYSDYSCTYTTYFVCEVPDTQQNIRSCFRCTRTGWAGARLAWGFD